MPEQFGLLAPNYWYSIVSAAPKPEGPERAAVAVLFGNGRPYLLKFYEGLPRLSSLAATDELRIYEAVLASIAEEVATGATDLLTLQATIGPQLVVEPRRMLLQEPTDEIVSTICWKNLARPAQPPRDAFWKLIRGSIQELDEGLDSAQFKQSMMLRDVRPEKIYGPEIRRFVRYNVPPLARAARGMGRDLLIDSLKLTKEFDPASIRSAGARIGEAFFVYQSRLRDIIRLRFNRDIRLVGVLHPSQPGTPDEVLLLREYIKASWAREEARVIDGDTTDIVKALVSERSWVNGETAA